MTDSITNESVVCAICYAYKVDSYSPTYLTRGDKIFTIDVTKDISISSNETIDMKLQYSDTNHTAAQWAAGNMKVEAQYRAFSGAASMAVETTENSKYHTVRVDAIGMCTKNCLTSRGIFRTHPQDFVTEDFKVAVKELTVEELENKVGVFYAIKLQLGGMVKRSFVMEATEEDNETKVTAELQTAFGKECLGASFSAAGSFETGRRSSNKNAKVRREWRAQGGDIDLWFQVGKNEEDKSAFSSAMEIAREWAKTIDNTNVYPFDFELRPLWELIAEFDEKKAQEFRNYLEEKWEKEGSRHVPTMFLPTKLRVEQLPDASKTFLLNTCRAHKTAMVEEAATAQSYLDSVMYIVDRKCYKKWRKAAESGKEEATEIRDIVSRDDDITVEELIEQLETRADHRFSQSQRYLGLWGNDSKESNRIEHLNKAFLDKLIKRLNGDLICQVSVEEWHVDLEECEKQVTEAVDWFNENISCMQSEDRLKNIVKAIGQVKSMQESLTGFLERLQSEVEK